LQGLKSCLEKKDKKVLVLDRDPKGLYQKVLIGEIDNFIGISKSPYQDPKNPRLDN